MLTHVGNGCIFRESKNKPGIRRLLWHWLNVGSASKVRTGLYNGLF